jgi:hypothetical protein
VGSWYWIGLATGIGVGLGVGLGSLLPGGRARVTIVLVAALAAAAGAGVGWAFRGWPAAAGGGAGGVLGALSSAPLVLGALRGGGTRFGVAAIVAAAGLVVAALGLVPGLGYAEALAAPALALRLRRRGAVRYAGLRILAKD